MKGDVTLDCSQCKDDGALYQVARLAMRPELNLQSVTNISNVSHAYLFPYNAWAGCTSLRNLDRDREHPRPPVLVIIVETI